MDVFLALFFTFLDSMFIQLTRLIYFLNFFGKKTYRLTFHLGLHCLPIYLFTRIQNENCDIAIRT